ncbi:MAG: GGDEF domain-containing protein [Coxiellaceae bacterium]|nr:GGDEF domain-containing protein [Coxiellaceae bacterium]
MKPKRSILHTVIIYTVLFSALLLLSVTFIVYLYDREVLIDAHKSTLTDRSQFITQNIENSLTTASKHLIFLSKTPPINEIINQIDNNDKKNKTSLAKWQSRLHVIFRSILENNNYYTQIRLVQADKQGRELVRLNKSGNNVYVVQENGLQNKSSRKYFQQALNMSQGSIMFSDINYNIERGQRQYPLIVTLRALTPIFSPDGKLFGFIIININIKQELRNIISNTKGNYDTFLIDNYNNGFVFNKKNNTLDFVEKNKSFPTSLFGINKPLSTGQFFHYLLKDKSRITVQNLIYSSENKETKVLTLVLSLSKYEMNQQILLHTTYTMLSVISVLVLICILIIINIRHQLKPLIDLTTTVARHEKYPDKSVTFPTHLKNEIGVLANHINNNYVTLQKIKSYDILTGLPNRVLYMQNLHDNMKIAIKKHTIVAILSIDINDFKYINDTYGYDCGDELLKMFAADLQKNLSANQSCMRISGDEFAVIIKADNLESLNINNLIKGYQDTLNKAYVIRGVVLNILVAGGIAIFPNHTNNSTDLMKYSHKARIISKQNHDGIFIIYNPKDR